MSDPVLERAEKIARTRKYHATMAGGALVGGMVGVIPLIFSGLWFFIPVFLLITGLPALLFWRLRSKFEILPRELVERGRRAAATVRAARYVGPAVRSPEYGPSGARRVEYLLALAPEDRAPHELTLVTYDGPPPEGLVGRSVVVFVDPDDPQRAFVDWCESRDAGVEPAPA